ncbi:hypothetical protein [Paenibacillus sp. J2TS4]|uniref:hypothetical protein n=1 Tax=Paenibacillus sp. J2TS4 TaxID=2807194 RepID=UPI001BCB1611|nr:hypothetical protein [Paenibacillus sp. J2TS4]
MIYKRDNWNMMSVEVNGKQLIVREISDQWGEDCRTFLSRPEMMHWVEDRFSADRFEGSPEEREAILDAFREV